MFQATALLCLALTLTGAPKPSKGKKSKKPVATKLAPPPGPTWATQPAAFIKDDAGRAFVSVGKTDDDRHPEAAEDDARQNLGPLIAKWQEKTLACAKQASEAKVTASQVGHEKGSLLDVTVETATTISLYSEKVTDRGVQGKVALVRMRHDLQSMIDGIVQDGSRSEALKAAVKSCGQRAFDELASR